MSPERCKQLYLPDTNVLITRFFTADGIAELIDFMPIEARSLREAPPNYHQIIRRVSTVAGRVRFRLECFPSFNYARDKHEIHPFPQGATFISSSASVGLASPVPLTIDGTGVVAEFSLPRGNTATFFLRQADQGSEANLLIPEKTGEVAFQRHHRFLEALGVPVPLYRALAGDGAPLRSRA